MEHKPYIGVNVTIVPSHIEKGLDGKEFMSYVYTIVDPVTACYVSGAGPEHRVLEQVRIMLKRINNL